MLKLYGFKKVNPLARGYTRDLRVLWALEEMKLPFELVGIDHPAHELNTEAFHRLNPFEQIPVIDDDGIVLSESGAILIYLAKKTGQLIPLDLAEESQVLRWCFVALNSIEIPLMNILMVDWLQDKSTHQYRQFLLGWANRHLSNLEKWLHNREHIATENFTIADILMSHVLSGIKDNTILQPFPNIKNYLNRSLARPAWKLTIERYFKNVEPG